MTTPGICHVKVVSEEKSHKLGSLRLPEPPPEGSGLSLVVGS